jgi:hypothetical protein
LDIDNYEDRYWHFQSKGILSGQFGCITFLLDAESFDYSQTDKESAGFIIVLSDQRDKPIITQDGYMISPGKKRMQKKNVLTLKALLLIALNTLPTST